MKLTSSQYIAKKGNVCPVCSSDELEAREIEVYGVEAYQNVICLKCTAQWVDVFNLVRYSCLETTKEN